MRLDAETAWCAGFFEGEGGHYTNRNIRGSKTYLVEVIRVVQSAPNRDRLVRFRRRFGGTIYKVRPNALSVRQGYVLQISGRARVRAVMTALSPYLT